MTDSTTDETGARDRFRFLELAEKKFSFLNSLGFKVSQRESTLLRFESSRVFVEVYHEDYSYHVGLDLGRLLEGEVYSLHELLTLVAPAELVHARCQAATPEVLERCLSTIAALVDKQCRPLLLGDPAAFASLRSTVAPLRARSTLQAQLGSIIRRADSAWEAKDLPLAMTLYEQAEPALERSRARRLAYLRKKAL